jgi:hypothetical protein
MLLLLLRGDVLEGMCRHGCESMAKCGSLKPKPEGYENKEGQDAWLQFRG